MSYQKLKEHFGHRLCIASYGDGAQYAVECEDCRAVVISRDRPDGRYPILHGAFDPECETCGGVLHLAARPRGRAEPERLHLLRRRARATSRGGP